MGWAPAARGPGRSAFEALSASCLRWEEAWTQEGFLAQVRAHCPETHTLCPADPMNALQSLTGGPAAGAAGLGLPARGPAQALGGMGGLGAMGQPMPLSGQPPPGTSGMAPHNMAVVSTATPQSEYTGGAGDSQPLPPEGGWGGVAWDPSPGAVLWGPDGNRSVSAPPPLSLQGQRSAPGPA